MYIDNFGSSPAGPPRPQSSHVAWVGRRDVHVRCEGCDVYGYMPEWTVLQVS